MIDTKIYRVALFVSLAAVVIALFSLKPQPKPNVSALAPDAFDGARAYETLKRIARKYPDRRPGSNGDRKVADLVDAKLAGLGFEVTRQNFKSEVDGRSVEMSNVIGTLQGNSEENIIVIANRDNERVGEVLSGGSGTAILLELATALNSIRHRKTITLVSSDGATAAGAGIRFFSENLERAADVDAIFVLSSLGARSLEQPFVIPWSNSDVFSPLMLERTAERSVRAEVGKAPRGFGTVEQVLRLAFPLALQEQGILLAEGLPAVTISSQGELPPSSDTDTLGSVSERNLSRFGKAVMAALLAVDDSQRVDRSPDQYVFFAGRVMPGWAIRLIVFALLMPVAFASIDALARALRWRLHIAPEVLRVFIRAVPFVVFLLGSYLFIWSGLLPQVPSGAFNPRMHVASFSSVAGWLVLACMSVGVFIYSRRFVGTRHLRRDELYSDAPGVAMSLILTAVALALWIVNPFATLLLLPAVHLWTFIPHVEIFGKKVIMPLMAVAGLAGPAAVLIYYAKTFDLGLGVFQYFGLLYAARVVSPYQAICASVIAACFVTVLLIVANRLRENGQSKETMTQGQVVRS